MFADGKKINIGTHLAKLNAKLMIVSDTPLQCTVIRKGAYCTIFIAYGGHNLSVIGVGLRKG